MRLLLMLTVVTCSWVHGQRETAPGVAAPLIRDLPTASQQGPSCAFFANLPMVAWATGYDVGTSGAFVRSVYGLRRGDFAFERAFDKQIFCELFSFPYEEVEIGHPQAVERELMPAAEAIITSNFDKALSQGRVFSLRVKGILGGAHNALLLGKQGDFYVVHDPRGGRMLKLTRKELAEWILVKSSATGRSTKPSHVTHFLKVEVPPAPVARVLTAGDFARELTIDIGPERRKALAAVLGRSPKVAAHDVAQWVAAHPEIDFAVIGDGVKRSAISADLNAGQLAGVLHLSQLTLNACKRGTRRLLPVLVLDGRPHLLTGYRTDPDRPQTTVWLVDNGATSQQLPTDELLERFRRSGALYGTIPLADALKDADLQLSITP